MGLETIIYISLVFLLAGTIKGIIGFGLPTVSLAIATAIVGLKDAMVLVLIPSLVTNLFQASIGGQFVNLLTRTWSLLLMLCCFTWFSTSFLVGKTSVSLTVVLGALLFFYGLVSLWKPQTKKPGRHEVWLSPVIGALTGVFTGLCGTFVFPSALYLQSLRIDKDQLVQGMGICFSLATISLGISLGLRGLISIDLSLISIGIVVPAFVGMLVGRIIRMQLNEEIFKKIFFSGLLLMGIWMVIGGIQI